MHVDIAEVGAASEVIDADVDLLVVGGPTHAFGMSRPQTRQGAAQQAERSLVSQGIGLREWLSTLQQGSARVAAAAFDTRINKPRLPGSAARKAEKRLPGSWLRYGGSAGKLLCCRVVGSAHQWGDERARRWGEELGGKLTAVERDRRVS